MVFLTVITIRYPIRALFQGANMNKTLKISVQRLPVTKPVWLRGMMAASLVAGAWALSVAMSPAQARDNVYWSIGVDSPGVQLGISNAPPVYVQRPLPVYVQPVPVVVYPGYGPGYGHGSRYERPRYVVPAQVYHQRPPRVVYVQPYGAPIGRDFDHRGHRHEDRGYGRGHDRGHNRYRD